MCPKEIRGSQIVELTDLIHHQNHFSPSVVHQTLQKSAPPTKDISCIHHLADQIRAIQNVLECREFGIYQIRHIQSFTRSFSSPSA